MDQPDLEGIYAELLRSGFVLKVGMQIFWGEAVRGIAFEATAVASAGAAWVFAAWWRSRSGLLVFLASAWAVASVLALFQAYGYTYSGHAGPTNAVNWGASLALFMCTALAITIHGQALGRDRFLALLSLCAFSLAIFVSGRRGALFAVFWVMACGGYFWVRSTRGKSVTTIRKWSPALVALSVVFIGVTFREPLAVPLERIVSTVEEVSLRLSRAEDSDELPKGTLGGRIYMLELGLTAGSAAPVFGLGADKRARLIQRAETHLQEPLFHLHNEYLQAWVAYGIPGLVGVLCFPAGLVAAGWRARRTAQSLALALTGMGLVHLVSGMTNVNTFHNYYGTVFAVSVVIPFMLLRSGVSSTEPA